ncbi:MAG TPA: PAS domain-containing protein, partial [Crenalkalicoccus sp.]|nr:PAS domain-containing protein [Crenalkalicoccus sp.]
MQETLPAEPQVALLREVARGSATPSLVLGGPAHRILAANPAFCRAVGQEEAALLGRCLDSAFPEAAPWRRALEAVRTGRRTHRAR